MVHEAGEGAWRRTFSGSHAGELHLAFSPDASYMAMASGQWGGQVGQEPGRPCMRGRPVWQSRAS